MQILLLNDKTYSLSVLGQVSSGQQFENAVAIQLARLGQVSYYQRRSGQVVDFILDQSIAIEVKETPTPYDQNVLNERAESIGLARKWLAGRNYSGAGPDASGFTDWYWGGNLVNPVTNLRT